MSKRQAETEEDAHVARRCVTKSEVEKPTDALSALPITLVTRVWSFATDLDATDSSGPNVNLSRVYAGLDRFQRVCHAWRRATRQLTREISSNVAVLDVGAAVKNSTLALGEKLVIPCRYKIGNHTITDVRIVMGTRKSTRTFNDSRRFNGNQLGFIVSRVVRDASLREEDIPVIDWETTLAPFSATTTRLDLSLMAIYSRQVANVLRAATKLCLNVKVLLLPLLEKKRERNESARREAMTALGDAMKIWQQANGGLRYLSVPYIGMDRKVVTRFLANVTQYCPALEYLDGYLDTFRQQCSNEFFTCDLFYPVPASEFGKFWTKLEHLKEWNTVVMPLAKSYYKQIVLSPTKTHLTKLTISHNSLTHSDTTDRFESAIIARTLVAFPSLRELTIKFGFEGRVGDSRVDAIVNNSLLMAIGVRNPFLEQLSIVTYTSNSINTIGIRDVLLSLQNLKSITIGNVANVDHHDSRFAFESVLKEAVFRRPRELQLSITSGDVGSTILNVLLMLKGLQPQELEQVKFTLALDCIEEYGFKAETRGSYGVEDVRNLVGRVKEVHGDAVRIHVHVTVPDPEEDETTSVQVDSLKLSINDPANFECTREYYVWIGNKAVEQDLCGTAYRSEGVFERDTAGSEYQVMLAKVAKYEGHRSVHLTGLTDDESDQEIEEETRVYPRCLQTANDEDERFKKYQHVVSAFVAGTPPPA